MGLVFFVYQVIYVSQLTEEAFKSYVHSNGSVLQQQKQKITPTISAKLVENEKTERTIMR
jgi:hypothetical protein